MWFNFHTQLSKQIIGTLHKRSVFKGLSASLVLNGGKTQEGLHWSRRVNITRQMSAGDVF